MGSNPLLRGLLGPNHEQVVAKLRRRRRAPAATWSGQAGPRPTQSGLRPPPPPGGPAASGDSRHPWEMPTGGTPAATSLVPAAVPGEGAPEAAARSVPVRTARPTPAQGAGEGHQHSSEAPSSPHSLPTVEDTATPAAPPPANPASGSPEGDAPWAPASALPREPMWVRLRRVLGLGLVAVLLLVGALNVAATVHRWLTPSPPPAPAPATSSTALTGYAEIVALEYATWNENTKQTRQAALARFTSGETDIDGWNGTGIRRALSASTVDITRSGPHRAVVTVRVRTTTGAQAASASSGARPSWVALAIPMTHHHGRPRVTATPALVGSAPHTVRGPAVGTGTGDSEFADRTRGTVTKLLRAYASGDLSYARAAGTRFAGLGGTVRLAELGDWRVAPLAEGADPNRRVGDATVTWQLPSGAQVRCSYVVTLQRDQGRWYLAAITPQSTEGQQ